MSKPRYKIVWDGTEWVALTSEFKTLSGCGSTKFQALRKLDEAISMARKTLKENK